MGRVWRVASAVLGLRMCTCPTASAVKDGDDMFLDEYESAAAQSCPNTPARFSSPQSARNSLRFSKGSCPICLEAIKPGSGMALFTAECSHSFHFSCIASNVRHGNMVCPVCRAKWKEVPWNGSTPAPTPPTQSPARHFVSARASPIRYSPSPRRVSPEVNHYNNTAFDSSADIDDPVIRIIDESIANVQNLNRGVTNQATTESPQQSPPAEPLVYDDDQAPAATATTAESSAQSSTSPGHDRAEFQLAFNLHSEVGSVSFMESRSSFNVLVHLKARETTPTTPSTDQDSSQLLQRAPIDLVTVLDVSGSMAGTKLTLLKRAMAFVIRNLSSRDRLSVVVFSSSAKRLFPLRPMSEEGRQCALRAIETLVCSGGTNIAEGLRKGGKILQERTFKSPVASIMLLSDGQDTYSMGSRGQVFNLYQKLNSSTSSSSRPRTVAPGTLNTSRIPVHAFGFGADHDAATMHSISQLSGGTFSFIQAEGGVQDAFAQCVGGLLSVVAQNVELQVSAPDRKYSRIKRVHAGSYRSELWDNSMQAGVKLGDLYADEERDLLVEVELPTLESAEETVILEVNCSYTDPVHCRNISATRKIAIDRPEFVRAGYQEVSVEVDRQKNRLLAAKAMTDAGFLAEGGEIKGAQRVLEAAQIAIRGSVAVQGGDRLSKALEGELGEIQLRISNRQLFERCGRAYILSAQSSHLAQRATMRGHYNSGEDYQTPSMTGMILRSHQGFS